MAEQYIWVVTEAVPTDGAVRGDRSPYNVPKNPFGELELSVEVNGEGQLSLLGSGTKVGGSGALTLKFKRSQVKTSSENSKG